MKATTLRHLLGWLLPVLCVLVLGCKGRARKQRGPKAALTDAQVSKPREVR